MGRSQVSAMTGMGMGSSSEETNDATNVNYTVTLAAHASTSKPRGRNAAELAQPSRNPPLWKIYILPGLPSLSQIVLFPPSLSPTSIRRHTQTLGWLALDSS